MLLLSTLQHTATHCNTLQHTTRCNTHLLLLLLAGRASDGETHCNSLQLTTTHCNSLQHSAMHCTTLQHTAAYYFASTVAAGKASIYIYAYIYMLVTRAIACKNTKATTAHSTYIHVYLCVYMPKYILCIYM